MIALKDPTPHERNYYQNRYFIGMENNGICQLLHFNKGGYELRNLILNKAVIFHKKDKEHKRRFKTLKNGPFKNCKKIPCLKYLFGIEEKNQNWFMRLINKILDLWQR